MAIKSNGSVSTSSSKLGNAAIISVNLSPLSKVISKKHIMGIYKGVTYGCNQCLYKAT